MKNVKLSENNVKHVAKLANLVLTEKEIEKFQKQLSEVLDYVEVLREVDTEGVEPTSQVTGQENIFREDEIGPCLSQEETLSGSQNKAKGMFKIKAILEK